MRLLVIFALWVVIFGGAASAQPMGEAEQPPVFDGREIEFGAYPIGADLATLPGDLRAIEPCEPANRDIGDGSCLYRGDDGITYYVIGDRLIINKWVDVAQAPPGGLPYGLTGHETPAQALTHMRSRFSLPFVIMRNDVGEQLVTVDGLIRGGGGIDFLLYLIFSADGRFEQIKLEGPPTV